MTLHAVMDRDQGAAASTLRMAEAWRQLGHDVDVRSLDDLPRSLRRRAGELLFPWEVARWMLGGRGKVDVLDASTGDAWVYRTLPIRRRPLVVTRTHGLEHIADAATLAWAREQGARLNPLGRLYYGHYRLWEVARSLRTADLALFLNTAERDLGVQRLGVDPSRAAVVANGLSAHLIGLPTPRPTDGGHLGIAVIGAFGPIKGADRAVAALRPVLEEHPGVTVSFLGTLIDATTVRRQFPDSLHARITVVPKYRNAELKDLLAEHHVLLMASRSEGYPNAVLEAMACGLTPVVSGAPGAAQMVRDGVDGVVVADSTPSGMARALRDLNSHPHELDRLRREAHRMAQSRSWESVAQQQLALVEHALARQRSAAIPRS